MTEARKEIARQLAAVIADELEAQHGIGRNPQDIPMLVADAVLDQFEVSPIPPRDGPTDS